MIGTISASELLKMHLERMHLELPKPHFHVLKPSWLTITSWPLIDWTLAGILWRSCGGLLLLIIAASIIPGRLHTLCGRILRWPVLVLTAVTILSELIVYIMVRLFIKMAEKIFTTGKHRQLRTSLEKASSYDEWLQVAKKLDASQGRDKWQNAIDDDTSYTYNWAFINELMMDMRQARKTGDVILALVVLQECTRKNVGGIMNEHLFSYTNSGEPKMIVKEFLEEVVKTLKWLTEIASSGTDTDNAKDDEALASSARKDQETKKHNKNLVQAVLEHTHVIEHVVGFVGGPVQWAIHAATGLGGNPKGIDRLEDSASETEKPRAVDPNDKLLQQQQREQIKTFLKRARASYGRTALCLSGGAMMGCYHFGHVKALLDEGVLPHIISGTSAGSVVAAVLCTRSDEEIERDLKPEILAGKLTCFARSWPARALNLYEQGCLFDQKDWLELIEW